MSTQTSNDVTRNSFKSNSLIPKLYILYSLHISAKYGHALCAGVILQHMRQSANSNIDIKDRRKKCTALHYACTAGSVEVVTLLIDHGASFEYVM